MSLFVLLAVLLLRCFALEPRRQNDDIALRALENSVVGANMCCAYSKRSQCNLC
jgi:hypothetical protein